MPLCLKHPVKMWSQQPLLQIRNAGLGLGLLQGELSSIKKAQLGCASHVYPEPAKMYKHKE